jgi:hypothetical protein
MTHVKVEAIVNRLPGAREFLGLSEERPFAQFFSKIKFFVFEKMDAIVYHGQKRCETSSARGPCANKAYFQTSFQDKKYLCGVHSKKIKKRVPLPLMPQAQREHQARLKTARDQKEIQEARNKNVALGARGRVIVTKLGMLKEPEHHDGFLKVFANNRHQNRRDGFGCASLSPMRLGPVNHGQPGLPPCKNLENFHQGNKCFDKELEDGKPGPVFYGNRLSFYNDDTPHRRKYVGRDPINKNIPLFSVWVDDKGSEHHLTYIESRQLYCGFYQRLAETTADLATLRFKLDLGYNLQIVGYDGRPVVRSIQEEYLDPKVPFGHELVLYTLLTHSENQYPWIKHKSLFF